MGQIRTSFNVFQRVDNPELPCALLATAVRDIAPSNFTSMIRREELKREDVVWLLGALSEFSTHLLLSQGPLLGICLDGMNLWQPP